MGNRSEKVLDLRPVTFAYKDDAGAVMHYGLIAEEVATVYPDLVTRTASGEVQTVKYQELIPMLLNELQRQRQDLARLQALVGQQGGVEASACAAAGQAAPSTQ
jgi:Chaperone of endosialidase